MTSELRFLTALVMGIGLAVPFAFSGETSPPPRGEVLSAEPPPEWAPGAGATGGGSVEMASPPASVPQTGALIVKGKRVPLEPTQGAATTGLRGLRLVSASAGEARVSIDGQERNVRVGDTIAGDTLRRVEARRLVLSRREAAGRESTVIVRFDSEGRARVLVLGTAPSEAAPAR